MADTATYRVATVRQVWSDQDEFCFEIGPDVESQDCVELMYREKGAEINQRMMFPPKCARLVAAELIRCADEIDNAEKEKQ